MNAFATPDFDFAHRVERVTNISPASDAFVLFTLATLFFTIGCFAIWMWFIWRRGRKTAAQSADESKNEIHVQGPVVPSPDHTANDAEDPPAPWEKPADWWKQ